MNSTDRSENPEVLGVGPGDLLALLPAHKCGLYIEHNANRDVYQTVKDCVEEWQDRESSGPDWESNEAKARAIATDELWTLQ